MTKKDTIKLIAKIAVSTAALVFVWTKIDFQTTWETIKTARGEWLIGALIVYAASQALSSLRSYRLFLTLPLNFGRLRNLKLYWLGMFYNFFLPGGVGGDGYKVYWIHKHYNKPVKTLVMTLLSDRISGLVAICCYIVIFFAFFVDKLPMLDVYRAPSVVLIPLGIAAYYIFLRITRKTSASACPSVMTYSFVVQGLQMAAATIILLALGGQTSDIDEYMFLFMISSIASAVPITVGGIGAREMAFLIGSNYLSTDQNIAVSLSLMFYVCSLISSLPGLIYVVRPNLIER